MGYIDTGNGTRLRVVEKPGDEIDFAEYKPIDPALEMLMTPASRVSQSKEQYNR